MKQLLVKCTLLFLLAVGFSAAANAQRRVFVRVQPVQPKVVVVRPAAPRPDYVWVEGEYVPRGAAYVYRPGRWVAPRTGRVWTPGHWVREHRGSYWVPGYWSRA